LRFRKLENTLPKITAVFWDVGGVLLSNAWDREQRKRTLEHFKLDEAEFSDRHDMLVSSFERGKITLKEYLDRTVFYRPRPFAPNDFQDYMYGLSQELDGTLEFARALASSRKYLMSTINNESRELNLYRIQTFKLCEIFSLFVSSCFVRLRKPEDGIYKLALDLTQRPPNECVFIDDRALNLDAASRLGMQVIRKESRDQLLNDLQKLGVNT
jgi:putative hydrolase of the HAD superfamily